MLRTNLVKNASRKAEKVWPDTMRDDLLVETTRMILAAHTTYSALAKEAQISSSTLSNWVAGTTRCARTDTLGKVLKALHCKLVIISEDRSN